MEKDGREDKEEDREGVRTKNTREGVRARRRGGTRAGRPWELGRREITQSAPGHALISGSR